MKYIFPVSILLCFFINNSKAQLPHPDHIVICILENHDYTQIVGDTSCPFINALIQDTNVALFTSSFALTHPSQPNYIMLFSGDNQGVTNNLPPASYPFHTPNLGASLIQGGYSFTGYSEDLLSPGDTSRINGYHVRKHCPWIYWQGAGLNNINPNFNLPFTFFPSNYMNLPTVSFVIPNLINDMHDGVDPAAETQADTWIQNRLGPYIQWANSHNSLFILTFDEDDNSGSNNRVLTLFSGPMVKHGTYNQYINHYTLLRTLEQMYSLLYAGHSDTASAITYCWKAIAGIQEEEKFYPLSFYPNPMNDNGFFYSNEPADQFELYDLLGSLIKKSQHIAFPFELNRDNLSEGIYFYKFLSEGMKVTEGKILIN